MVSGAGTGVDADSEERYQRVQIHASIPDHEMSWTAAFAEVAKQDLADIGEIQDAVAAEYDQSHLRPAAAASGFAVRGDNEVLDVFLALYNGGLEVANLRKAEVDCAFRRLHSFVTRVANGLHKGLEETSDGFDMAQRVQALPNEVTFIRLFLVTDSIVKVEASELAPVDAA